MRFDSIENELLYRICYYSLLPNPHDWLFSSKTLTNIKSAGWEELQISRYKARIFIKSWEAQGLIAKSHVGGQDEEGNVHCHHGYEITEKMKNIAPYDQAKKDVAEYVAGWLGGHHASKQT